MGEIDKELKNIYESGETVFYKPLPPKPAVLLIVDQHDNIYQISLNGSMTLGRDTEERKNDINIPSTIVSRNHGVFIYDDGAYYYRDNNSLNGTFINSSKLVKFNERGSKAVRLKDGDILRIDRVELGNPHPEAILMLFSTTLSDTEKWSEFYFNDRQGISIGRAEDNEIILDDFMASRKHACITKKDDRYYIENVSNKNWVAINNHMIEKKVMLNKLDVIRIADTNLIFTGNSIIHNKLNNNKLLEEKPADREYSENILSVNIDSVKVRPNNLIKNKFNKQTLLSDINLNIEAGDFVLILGGSGAGKTTFLRALLGERGYRAEGKIELEGMDLYENFKMLKHRIGMVPQFSTTRDSDTVYHTVMDAAVSKLSSDYSKEELEKRVNEILQKLMLTNFKDSLIKNLSGGQKKRVEVAIQAVCNQRIFILDEPDSGMDYASRTDLMKNLKECTTEKNVVMVISHSPDDVSELFTKVIVLAKCQDQIGHLAFYGDVENAYDFFGVKKLSEIIREINSEGGHGRADEFVEKFNRMRNGGFHGQE